MDKKRVAFFDFTCCEGCQLQVANMGEALLDLMDLITIVEFREVMSEKSDEYDIAIIEGSITTPHDIERLKDIRLKAKTVIAYGSCAAIGGINGIKNSFDLDEIKNYVYGEEAKSFASIKTMALSQVIDVDYTVYGCPVYLPEFVKILGYALKDIPYIVKDEAVCVECKQNENECLYEKGITCLGPITKAGCNSWCINNGNTCYGCRGMVKDTVKNGCKEVLKRYEIPLEWIEGKIDMYNQASDEGKSDK